MLNSQVVPDPSSNAKCGVRRHSRVLYSVPFAFRHLMAGGMRSARGVSIDISEGGMGAVAEGGLQVGDAVLIQMELPGGNFSAVAIVRHASDVRSGFEFLGLNSDERARIAALASSNGQPRPRAAVWTPA